MRKLIKFTKKRLIKFQRSVRVVMILTLANLAPMSAKAKDTFGADAFTFPPMQRNKAYMDSGIFAQPPANNPSGGGSSPDFSEPKSVQSPKLNSPYEGYRFSEKKKELETCSQSESDWDASENKYWARDMMVEENGGKWVTLGHAQMRDKAYHLDVFKETIELQVPFDWEAIQNMPYYER